MAASEVFRSLIDLTLHGAKKLVLHQRRQTFASSTTAALTSLASSPTTSGWPHRLAGFLFKGIQQLVQPAQSLFLKSDCLLGWRQVQSAISMVRISCTLPELLTGIFYRLGRFLDKSPENLCLRQLLFSKVGGLDAQFLFRVTQTQRAINQTLAPG